MDLFPSTYHYRSRFTADVLSGMQNLVASCEKMIGELSGKIVLDIGCNDGSLLDFFAAAGAVAVGVEPTDAVNDAKQKGHATFHGFLDDDVASAILTAHGTPDIITFTNVFAHIEDLDSVLAVLRRLMSPSTLVVIENHYLGSVLDGNQFDTFYHEHPRTYSATSFVHIAKALGVSITDVQFPSRYGGNIRVFLGSGGRDTKNSPDLSELAAREAKFGDRLGELQVNVWKWRDAKRQELAAQVEGGGKLRAKAFPGRAAILVKLLELDTQSVEAVHEKPGSLKIGYYVPGTRIPIVSDDELFQLDDQTRPLLNFAWHIPAEIRSYLTAHGYQGPIIDVLRPEDVAGNS